MAVGILFLWPRGQNPPKTNPALNLTEILAGADTAGFARALTPRPFIFPADSGPHPRFKTEWWYYTGNLVSRDGQQAGFQLTFFRSALTPVAPAGASDWRTNQFYMGHFGLTDVSRGEFCSYERFSRAAAGLAGAQAEPFRVWLEDWCAEAVNPADRDSVPAVRLYATGDDVSIDIRAASTKHPVLQGVDGLSQKGNGPGNASYYYSLTRMMAEGVVKFRDRSLEVRGTVWMDREWSTSALELGQAGWDWFSLQMNDETELMYYQLRRVDGSADPNSRGVFVDKNGGKTTVLPSEVRLEILDRWNSPFGGEYPSKWCLVVEKLELDVVVTPLLPEQELDVSIRYWEGAVRAEGTREARTVNGAGYVELTGYAE